MDNPAIGQPNGHVSIEVPTNNGYGEDNKLIAAARAANAAGSVAAGNTETSPDQEPDGDPDDKIGRAEAALGSHAPGDLLAPSARPDEAVTAGLPIGPGAGPEALGQPTMPRVARVLDSLASSSNNPVIASLAGEAASRNL